MRRVLRRWYAKSVGIRREDKNRWECRVPLTPVNISELKARHGDDLEFVVQPCRKRAFAEEQYLKAGARVDEDLSACDLILGVKEVPLDRLLPNKSYLFFSHTHKGQRHNVSLLRTVCERNVTLLDYELLTDEQGRRLVAFGRFAGYAGMVTALHGLGDRLLTHGIRTPFLHVAMTQSYRDLKHIGESLDAIGREIADQGIDAELAPLVFVFTGQGNVSQGAQAMFKHLPHEWIRPDELKALVESGTARRDCVYGCVVDIGDYIQRNDGEGGCDVQEYLQHPDRFHSIFHEKIAPYASVLVNGIYWESKYPRLLTTGQMKRLQSDGRSRLLHIADISCDLGGSIEFMNKASTIDSPFYYYDPVSDAYSERHDAAGIQIMSIDNLPTQLPRDASEFFGKCLQPLISSLVGVETSHTPVAERSKITEHGRVVSRFQFLNDTMAAIGGNKRVLILGSGYVVPPVIDYLTKQSGVSITVGTNTPDEAERTLKRTHGDISIVGLDVTADHNTLKSLIGASDVVISLLSATMHVPIAEECIRQKRHMITASYISADMQRLDGAAREAGVLLLNEIGLDPGLDHLAAMDIIDAAKLRGEHIESFVSWCGGLPAPEHSNNCLGYKFSWSPRGVLLATQNDARYMRNGRIVKVSGAELLQAAVDVDIHPALKFEGLPNRDSLKYIELYRLEGIETMFRGTLRYKGFCKLMDSFRRLGLLRTDRLAGGDGQSWREAMESIVGVDAITVKTLMARLVADEVTAESCYNALSWLGALDGQRQMSTKLTGGSTTILDAFCALLETKLQYASGERDMAYMHHEFITRLADGRRKRITADLCEFGVAGGHSAMARTVGLPVAVSARLILEKRFSECGVQAPLAASFYRPLLDELTGSCGIRFTLQESILPVNK